jgi:hypothetical protein
MAKAAKKTTTKPNIKRIQAVNDKPVHIPLSFDDAVKLALNTPIKKKRDK